MSWKNLTDGGPTQKFGWSHSSQTKKTISIKNTGKIRQANIGRADDGRYAKISKTMKGRPWSEARRLAYQNKNIKEL